MGEGGLIKEIWFLRQFSREEKKHRVRRYEALGRCSLHCSVLAGAAELGEGNENEDGRNLGLPCC